MSDSSSPSAAAQPVPAEDDQLSLEARLVHAEETIRAIHGGEVDAVVVNGPQGLQVYTLEGADHPYRVLVEQMHEGSFTVNEHGLILYSNPQFSSLIGAPVSTVTGAHVTGFVQDADANTFASLLEAALHRRHSSGNLNLRHQKGTFVPVRLSLTLLDMAGMHTVSVLVSDLREQQRSEAILKEERLSRQILDQAGESIVVIDPQGIVVRRSESAKALAGGAVLLERFDDVFQLTAKGGPLTADTIVDTVPRSPIRGLEATLHQGARKSELLISASPLWSDAGQMQGCVVILTDITARKRAEEALARQADELARSNADLRQFAYSASHDLREPLRQLAVFSELIEKRYSGKLGTEGAALVSHAVSAAHRMEKMVADLMAYIQAADAPSQDGPAFVDTNEVVKKILGTFESHIADAGARIEFGDLPVLNVHEVHLVQLLQNLIGNALKYKGDRPPVIRIRAERSEALWRLSVEDNGIGISADYLTKIFGLFQRLHGGDKYSGSGIGLAICQKIVNRYGGTIWAESEPGRGSRFLFTLPGEARTEGAAE